MTNEKMREEFEKWARLNHNYDPGRTATGYYYVAEINRLWSCWQVAHKSAVPDGYCVVPIEPTDEMVTSGNDAMTYDLCSSDASAAWRAMIADRPREF